MERKVISIAKDFSPYAAGRYYSDGPFSGQRFREEVLLPCFTKFENIEVDLDGTLGLGSSFLEETFGGLVRHGLALDDLKKRLTIKSKIASNMKKAWGHIEKEALSRTSEKNS